MSGRPCGWLFRVTLAAAALLRPERRARPLAVRPAARPRSPVPGKCAASLQPPGLRRPLSARSRARDPRSRLEGQCGPGRCPSFGLCPRRARGASITDRTDGSSAGASRVLRWGGASPAPPPPHPQPPPPGQVLRERCALLPPRGAVRLTLPFPFLSLPQTLPELFSLPPGRENWLGSQTFLQLPSIAGPVLLQGPAHALAPRAPLPSLLNGGAACAR